MPTRNECQPDALVWTLATPSLHGGGSLAGLHHPMKHMCLTDQPWEQHHTAWLLQAEVPAHHRRHGCRLRRAQLVAAGAAGAARAAAGCWVADCSAPASGRIPPTHTMHSICFKQPMPEYLALIASPAAAPIWSYLGETPPYDAGSFAAIVTRDASPEGGSAPACAPNVRAAWQALDSLGDSGASGGR